jgi:penicillin-binding protein 2
MFERRLKIFFGCVIAMTLLIVLRAAHLQLIKGAYWQSKAAEDRTVPLLLQTTRGEIVDYRGQILATNEPCIDAAVDYRAIVRDPKWMQTIAIQRLGPAYRRTPIKQRPDILKAEIGRVEADLDAMWKELADVSGKTPDEIEEIKSAIFRRIDTRRRSVQYQRFRKASENYAGPDAPWYHEWGLGQGAPDVDSYAIEVTEQMASHVIVGNISPDAHVRLKKQSDRFPGLDLRPGRHRIYPFGQAASHVLGHLSMVSDKSLANDPNSRDEMLKYYPSDLIGTGGIEAICEIALRGKRGRQLALRGQGEIISSIPPQDGRDVRTTLDIYLQQQIEKAYADVTWKEKNGTVTEHHEMHGGAVVIDIPTGQVRAMVSYPTFDLNRWDQDYPKLAADIFGLPLFNRATQMAVEPGSTVKPIVALGAITQGAARLDEGIECTGYLKIDGQFNRTSYRCWTASKWAIEAPDRVAHHQMPTGAEHPTGFLNVTDALQRSCNVYFENLGDRLRLEGLAYWYDSFGLGRTTGIGLDESSGRTPAGYDGPSSQTRQAAWLSAIGQGHVLATPLQMANVAATIARDGVWVRPTLVVSKGDIGRPTTAPARLDAGPDRVVLPLDPRALAAVKEGMYLVVNSKAGTGPYLHRDDIVLCGKTGTAQAAPLKVAQRDSAGHRVRDAKNEIVYDTPTISTATEPNPDMLWYRGQVKEDGVSLHHAWFIGFAPRENPQIALAVLMEYGDSGGHDTAPIVHTILDACIKQGYLAPRNQEPPLDPGQ